MKGITGRKQSAMVSSAPCRFPIVALGVWMSARHPFSQFKRHGIHPQLWVCGSRGITATNDAERIEAEAARIRSIAEDAAALGCKVGLYNHREPWFEEQDHQIAIIERLKRDGVTNVGIVFNFHHWRGSLAEFPALFKRIQPYLIAVNLNGMRADTMQYPGVRCIGSTELYDHSTDEAEYHNVITNPDHAPLVKRLHSLLDLEFGPMTALSPRKAAVK